MKSNNDFDAILDNATAEIRSETVDSAVVDKAAERVWARLAAEPGQFTNVMPATERIGSCADFQSLIPAYLTGSLSEARSMLLVDHTHECIPCRKALLVDHGIEIGGGLGAYAGKLWRIGLMGHTARTRNVTLLLAALADLLDR